MDEMKLPRLLRKEEIEVRVGAIYEHGLTLLLYKDARSDMKILDEWQGILGWQRSHELIDGDLFCTISIWDSEKNQWVSKSDVGTYSTAEKEKGRASSAMKRSATCWGVGRELYTAPFIWIPSSKVDIARKGERLVTNERFSVEDIQYNEEREISYLKIKNASEQVVFTWRKKVETKSEEKSQEDAVVSDESGDGITAEQVQLMEREIERTGVSLETVLKRYKLSSVNEMGQLTYRNAMNGLKKTKSKRVA